MGWARRVVSESLGSKLPTVSRSTPTPAMPISLEDAGLREREHLPEWVIANPCIIGAGTMVVTSEFSRSGGRSASHVMPTGSMSLVS